MYFPRVMGYDATTRKHTLLYDADGLEEELELSGMPYMVLAWEAPSLSSATRAAA